MKKMNLEKLTNEDLFGSFKKNKISNLVSENLKAGGTSTTLCKTTESWLDDDSDKGQEDLDDSRCSGY